MLKQKKYMDPIRYSQQAILEEGIKKNFEALLKDINKSVITEVNNILKK